MAVAGWVKWIVTLRTRLMVTNSAGSPSLQVIAIDHLPTLLPREASEQFSADLLPSLLEFPDREHARVWRDAKKIYEEKLAEAAKVENI